MLTRIEGAYSGHGLVMIRDPHVCFHQGGGRIQCFAIGRMPRSLVDYVIVDEKHEYVALTGVEVLLLALLFIGVNHIAIQFRQWVDRGLDIEP